MGRHKKFRKEVIERLRIQNNTEIESISTKESRIVYEWNKQVAGCYQRCRAFLRLKISKKGIVYGKIEPEHFVEDLVAKWFLSRFPMFIIMIQSPRGTFVISNNKELKKYDENIEELLPRFEAKIEDNKLLNDLTDFNDDSYWEKYYDSQFIKTQKNKKYFLHNIPKKFHNWDSLRLEKNRFDKNKKLDEFGL